MSQDTIVSEISWMPAGSSLEIDTATFAACHRGPTLADVVLDADIDPVFTLRRAAGFIGGVVAALARVDRWNTSLQLSGGYDSRVVLAASQLSGSLPEVRVQSANSTPAHKPDFSVAEELARRFDFGLNERAPVEPWSVTVPAKPLSIWGAGNLAVYDRLMPTSSRRRIANNFELTGLGAEAVKGNWGWTSISSLVNSVSVTGARKEALESQIHRGAAAVGADPSWSDASEFYYLGYRNGLHGAGHTPMHLTGFRLLQQLDLVKLGHSRSDGEAPMQERENAEFDHARHAIIDLLMLLSPELALADYDRPEKSLRRDYVEQRLASLGGPMGRSELLTVEVHGAPESAAHGPSRLAMAVAVARGFDRPMVPAALLSLGAEALDSIVDADVHSAYQEVLAKSRWRLVQRGESPTSAGPPPAKAAFLRLF